MKKNIVLTMAATLLLAISGSLNAQNFKQSEKNVSELYTKKKTSLVSAEGDFDKDGKKDLVVSVIQDYTDTGDETDFAFYFGNAQGGYTLFRAYNASLPENVKITVNDKGVVRIERPVSDAGTDTDVFLFRYQEGDFRLIGGKKDRHKSEHYDISYNLLTDKMIRTDGEGKARKSVTSAMPKLPVLKLGWFPMNFNMLDYLFDETEENRSMEYLTVMGIFRLMQANEMLFWHFCDYKNPYRNPRGENGEWIADDDLMKPACYNTFSTLSITKQKDGSYLLDLIETFDDRSYEQQLNDDLSNLDEVMPDNTQSSTRTKWIFKNGQFKQIFREE